MGHVTTSTTGGTVVFPLPSHPSIPLLRFDLIVTQTSPDPFASGLHWISGFSTLGVVTQGPDYVVIPIGPNPPGFSYTGVAFSFAGFTLDKTPGTVDVTAEVGLIPEPATVVLLVTA